VAYAEKELKADVIVDMATLTGGQGVATGKWHAAIVTNSEQWERACVESGKASGDLCYPLVFTPELHFSEFSSELADMRNSVLVGFHFDPRIPNSHFFSFTKFMFLKKADNATSACASLFIHAHLSSQFEGVWLHIDMASPVLEVGFIHV
jgi:probable aminopeptidase NPEPL1